MPYVQARDGTNLYYKDWGSGPPVVLIHGWPVNADMWEQQQTALAEQGFRAIAYDRRGFGRSDQPWSGYDYDTFADDLAAIIETLDLRGVALVGFSMGGGEVARYLQRHGADRVSKAVLAGAVTPFLLKTDDHPNGAPQELFDGMIAGIRADRPAFLAEFTRNFYGGQVSDAVMQWHQGLALQSSLRPTIECVRAFGTTDFRADMKAFTVPTLIIHGDADAIVPIEISARTAAEAIRGAQLKEYPGAPHGLAASHGDRLTADLLEFLRS